MVLGLDSRSLGTRFLGLRRHRRALLCFPRARLSAAFWTRADTIPVSSHDGIDHRCLRVPYLREPSRVRCILEFRLCPRIRLSGLIDVRTSFKGCVRIFSTIVCDGTFLNPSDTDMLQASGTQTKTTKHMYVYVALYMYRYGSIHI